MTIDLPEDVEASILAKVRGGIFPSMDAAMTEAARLLLERFEHDPGRPETPSSPRDGSGPPDKPFWERILESTADISEEEWDKLPTDLAEQHDHYIYGTPKRSKP